MRVNSCCFFVLLLNRYVWFVYSSLFLDFPKMQTSFERLENMNSPWRGGSGFCYWSHVDVPGEPVFLRGEMLLFIIRWKWNFVSPTLFRGDVGDDVSLLIQTTPGTTCFDSSSSVKFLVSPTWWDHPLWRWTDLPGRCVSTFRVTGVCVLYVLLFMSSRTKRIKTKVEESTLLTCTLLCVELEQLKIETRLIDEMFASEMGEYVSWCDRCAVYIKINTCKSVVYYEPLKRALKTKSTCVFLLFFLFFLFFFTISGRTANSDSGVVDFCTCANGALLDPVSLSFFGS